MGLFDGVTSLLSQYVPGAGATHAGDVSGHFQQLSQSVDAATLAPGIVAALRSDQTPPFPSSCLSFSRPHRTIRSWRC